MNSLKVGLPAVMALLFAVCPGFFSVGANPPARVQPPQQVPQAPSAIQLEAVVTTGLSSPVYVTSARDGTNRLFIVEQPGTIKVRQPNGTITTFLDITSRVFFAGGNDERGLLGLAFHPQYETNRRFFVHYTRDDSPSSSLTNVIAEYHASAMNPNEVEKDGMGNPIETEILAMPQPFTNHNGGMIEFGPDGLLYIAKGDGGSGNDPGNRAQNINELLGKILRINIDIPAPPLAYSSPATNPFCCGDPPGGPDGRDEIYAYGMRNPWRVSFDRGGTNQLYAGDVGQAAWEEIDIITLGGNYGWRVFEGMHCTGNDPDICTSMSACNINGYTCPIAEYSSGGNPRCSITGGYVYRGTQSSLPLGTYVYADYCTGEIFQYPPPNGQPNPYLLLDTALFIASFGEDEAGEIYVVGRGGTIHRIAALPTALELAELKATGYNEGVSIEWQTGYEVDNLGFNLYRDANGERSRVNPQMLAGSALMAGEGATLTAGKSYSWWDGLSRDKQGAQYWLEEVDLQGQSKWHGPIAINYSGKQGTTAEHRQAIAVSSLGRDESQDDSTQPARPKASPTSSTPAQSSAQAGLAGSAAVKLSVREDGWFRVTQQELVQAGLDSRVDPRFLQLYVEGREQAVLVTGEKDGRFDPSDTLEFYGIGLDTPSTDTRVYWLVAGSQPGKRVQQAKGKRGKIADASFPYAVEHKRRTIYFSGLKNGDRENFFGSVIAGEPVNQQLTLQHVDPAPPGNAHLEIALQGVTQSAHRVKIFLNGAEAGTVTFAGQDQGLATLSIPQTFLREGQNQVTLAREGEASDISLVDYIRVTYWHTHTADNDALTFTVSGRKRVTIDGFSNKQIRVMDITDPSAAQEINGSVAKSESGFAITASGRKSGKRTLLAFTDERVKKPAAIAANHPSDWRSTEHSADLVIITHRGLVDSLEPLAALRRRQGLSVSVVDVEDLYDEFNYGNKAPLALRDFFTFAKSNWKTAPRFVLFAGDASFDPRNYLGEGDFDLVPTKLVDTAYLETASDEWFADFNSDGLSDIPVGRLPIRNSVEAATIVSKIVGYDSSTSLDGVLLVSDTNDSFDFEAASAELRALVPTEVGVEEFRRGQWGSGARDKLLESLNRGPLMVNYTGHGSADMWRGQLLSSADARGLVNGDRLSLFVMMTCLNGYFHNSGVDSLAESLMKAERGGAVAVWASSAITVPGAQASMNQALYRLIFAPNNPVARSLTLGEAIAIVKAGVSDEDLRRSWILFGDPTMQLR
ncbi:MAG TPA: C25 family cysteine peptidase [Blastocatellia bacterium]|nr:C25 family cysteine peptidase [Blastocatellia bacterium]